MSGAISTTESDVATPFPPVTYRPPSSRRRTLGVEPPTGTRAVFAGGILGFLVRGFVSFYFFGLPGGGYAGRQLH